MPSSEVHIRLGSHAEKEYLLKTAKLFSGVIVGANLLEMTPGASVSLAWKFRTLERQFAIDPMTYVFGIDLDYIASDTKDKKTKQTVRDMKKSFQSLCKEFGGVLKDEVLQYRRSLAPSDLTSKDQLVELCECVLNYQLTRMNAFCEADPQLRELEEDTSPAFVFSPYFYIPGDNDANSDVWETVNLNLIRRFGQLQSPLPKHAVLCFARRILKNKARLMGMLDAVMDSGCDAAWYWVSNFREEEVTPSELQNLIAFVEAAGNRNFELRNMHGGFMSALLSKRGLSGFSHSIGYGESKDVFPVSAGALPTVNYHYLPLHTKSSVLDIERAFSTLGITDAESFHELVCDCSICKGTLKGNLKNFRKFGESVLKPNNIRESQTPDSAKRCRFHFLLARRKELTFVNSASGKSLRNSLSQIVTEYQGLPPNLRLRDKTDYLAMWTGVL
jgi:hypothetical protein